MSFVVLQPLYSLYDVEQIETDKEQCSDSDLVWDVEGMRDMQKDVIATLVDTKTSLSSYCYSRSLITSWPSLTAPFSLLDYVSSWETWD